MFSKGVDSLDRTQDDPVHCMPGLTAGLSGRLLLLTVIFVMIAEVLIFVPSVANMRLSWLRDRLNTAAAAGAVIDGLQAELPRSVQNDTLMATGAKLIALRKDGTSRLLAVAETPPRNLVCRNPNGCCASSRPPSTGCRQTLAPGRHRGAKSTGSSGSARRSSTRSTIRSRASR